MLPRNCDLVNASNKTLTSDCLIANNYEQRFIEFDVLQKHSIHITVLSQHCNLSNLLK